MENCGFNEKEQMTDLLTLEKHLAGSYNSFALEAATPEVVNCLGALLNDTHRMQQQIFAEMSSRGWYPTPKAEDTKIMEARQKFATATGK
ncbi:MAG: spore coat protein [Ruminococcaceae bacterium]|nr:spore coat protein [Oscillospiraceae bacterium]